VRLLFLIIGRLEPEGVWKQQYCTQGNCSGQKQKMSSWMCLHIATYSVCCIKRNVITQVISARTEHEEQYLVRSLKIPSLLTDVTGWMKTMQTWESAERQSKNILPLSTLDYMTMWVSQQTVLLHGKVLNLMITSSSAFRRQRRAEFTSYPTEDVLLLHYKDQQVRDSQYSRILHGSIKLHDVIGS